MKALHCLLATLLAASLGQLAAQTPAYPSCNGLVMAGYQGWFSTPDDGLGRGWHHYQKKGKFEPGYVSVDFWPDVSDYHKTYETAFFRPDGSKARVYSPADPSTADLHFRWMKEYGIDGVYLQRFVSEIRHEKGKRHFDTVLENALSAASRYGRAVSIMYDLSGCSSADMDIVMNDWTDIRRRFALDDPGRNPTYLHHRNRPLLAVWGVGFNDNRKYTTGDVQRLVRRLKESGLSLLIGVPYYWRTLDRDTLPDSSLHEVIADSDVVMPWAVGRYNGESYARIAATVLEGDLRWCRDRDVDYMPLAFPGFSWGNLKESPSVYNQIPREKGTFFWKQVAGARTAGAGSLYVAMFDEIDEGTAIFKTLGQEEVPGNASGRFVGIETGLPSDYYLWLTGQAGNWFNGKSGYGTALPRR